ncbi:AMP-binding protein [Pseudomonas sp. FP1911]|uniref:AMP-binding protein n=1 Tax=uncultured Pseudomonas sp. TaxID=114707 RepID=UPI0015880D49|nr:MULTISPECIES: AMP-binding protein [Pseudomonas]WLG77680.1 AMP-binding protein [Pseudomonas sp. FP1911]
MARPTARGRVTILARRGLDTLAGLLAILKSEACYVPLDPAHPAERLEYLLHDSAPVAILTQQNQGHGWLALYKP